jgi:ribonuclease E
MVKKMLIDATHAEETRVVVVDGNKVEEFDFETINKRQIAGNIYLAKVTRVEPSLQAAFVDYGGNRHGFLAFAEIHPDYYQIPLADRKALLEEERAFARAEEEEDNNRSNSRNNRRPRPAPRAAAAASDDAVVTAPATTSMDVVDLGEETGADALVESPRASQGDSDQPFNAVDSASDTDEEIESIAEEDVAEEISQTRRPRARRYKIQEVVKVRQIMLVQVVKEERQNKGAALTTYLSLAGRYCVLMPNTARGGGISRKITMAADRKKLKEIAQEIEVPEGAGLIIRTAGAKRTKPEIRRDYEYLMRLWEQVRELTLRSIAPAPIYEEGDLIKRSIRDLYNREIDEVLVEGEAGYRTAKDFMRMIMPAHAKSVMRYDEAMPLFARYQVESYLGGMFNPTVQLKSGGYIVIGITEALVAIDVNSGRATKEGSIEDTALKTNLEAAEEVARQLRLRDLAGLIVIDFIDMEERRNNLAVEKRIKDKLKTDRARIQVGRISGFGLLEMSRQRLRPGMLESTTQPCPHCHGTGLIRSDDSQGLQVLRALEEEGTRKRSKEVLLKAPIGIVNFLINQKREHIALIEARYGMSVRIECDPVMVSPDYSIEKFKTATRVVSEAASAVISGNSSMMGAEVDEADDFVEEDDIIDDVDDAEEAAAPSAQAQGAGEGADGTKKKRKRRRRRRGGAGTGQNSADAAGDDADDGDDEAEDGAVAPIVEASETAAPKPRGRTRSRSAKPKVEAVSAEALAEPIAVVEVAAEAASEVVEVVAEKPKPKPRAPRVSKAKAAASAAEGDAVVEAVPKTKEPAAAAKSKPVKAAPVVAAPVAEAPVAKAPVTEAPVAAAPVAAAPVAATSVPEAQAVEPPTEDGPPKPKRKGWWALGR